MPFSLQLAEHSDQDDQDDQWLANVAISLPVVSTLVDSLLAFVVVVDDCDDDDSPIDVVVVNE